MRDCPDEAYTFRWSEYHCDMVNARYITRETRKLDRQSLADLHRRAVAGMQDGYRMESDLRENEGRYDVG
jgi:hypothetical protein